jgi:hypothetical protein
MADFHAIENATKVVKVLESVYPGGGLHEQRNHMNQQDIFHMVLDQRHPNSYAKDLNILELSYSLIAKATNMIRYYEELKYT